MAPLLKPGDVVLVERVPLGSLKIGDIIAFRSDVAPTATTVMRIAALPGDAIRFDENDVFLNDAVLDLSKFGIEYKKNTKLLYAYGYAEAYSVPSDTVFVIGDNFDRSLDSRANGPVDHRRIVGRVRK